MVNLIIHNKKEWHNKGYNAVSLSKGGTNVNDLEYFPKPLTTSPHENGNMTPYTPHKKRFNPDEIDGYPTQSYEIPKGQSISNHAMRSRRLTISLTKILGVPSRVLNYIVEQCTQVKIIEDLLED